MIPNEKEIKKLIEQKRKDPAFMQRLERIFNENKEVLTELVKRESQAAKNKKPPTP